MDNAINDRKRVTVILGAGAALELAPENCEMPTTENITRSILNCSPILYTNGKRHKVNLIVRIYKKLCKKHHPEPLDSKSKNSAAKIHFEILFHVIEMLDTYTRSIGKNTHHKNIAPFANFIKTNFMFNADALYVASKHIIEKIFDIVINYDSRFFEDKNNWYRGFWNEKNYSWDLFNLNYDTTIEQSLSNYEDGFEKVHDDDEFQRFNINKLLSNSNNLSTVNHIHGCVLYGMERNKNINQDVFDFEFHDMYKWSDSTKAREQWEGTSTSNEYSQTGQTIIQGPIITGLSKTDKTTCLPYDIYRYNLIRSIHQNAGLLIAGYSFGDLYVNHAINRLGQCHGDNKRVVLIDYWNVSNYIKKLKGNNCDVDNYSLSPLLFENYVNDGCCNDEELLFIKRIAHRNLDIWETFDKLSLTEPMVSENGQLMLFIGGMKNTLSKYSDRIYQFLGL